MPGIRSGGFYPPMRARPFAPRISHDNETVDHFANALRGPCRPGGRKPSQRATVPDADTGPRVDLDAGEIPLRASPAQRRSARRHRGPPHSCTLRSGSSHPPRRACALTGISAACRIIPVYFAAERHAAAGFTKTVESAASFQQFQATAAFEECFENVGATLPGAASLHARRRQSARLPVLCMVCCGRKTSLEALQERNRRFTDSVVRSRLSVASVSATADRLRLVSGTIHLKRAGVHSRDL